VFIKSPVDRTAAAGTCVQALLGMGGGGGGVLANNGQLRGWGFMWFA
jgi:hypothetical protein